MKLVLSVALFITLAHGASVKTELNLDPGQIMELTGFHKGARAASGPSAANMRPLIWDEELAYEAMDDSRNCYNFPISKESRKYGEVGVNEYISKGQLENFSEFLRKTFDAWGSEMMNYDFYKATCNTGYCGNYTQLVWAESHRFGCGMTTCDGVETGDGRKYGVATLFLCRYYPAGNVEGRAPFKEGARCSECDLTTEECKDEAFCFSQARDGASRVHAVHFMTSLCLPILVVVFNQAWKLF
ncbi:peptidase inhibitor R3HDML-like [Styela clava]